MYLQLSSVDVLYSKVSFLVFIIYHSKQITQNTMMYLRRLSRSVCLINVAPQLPFYPFTHLLGDVANVERFWKSAQKSSTATLFGISRPRRTLTLFNLLCSTRVFHLSASMSSSKRMAKVRIVVVYAQSLHLHV